MDIDLAQLFPFKLDDFQLEAIQHLCDGQSVVVCAPTGSGKTVIAEYAVELSLRRKKRCYYTTPLKALSNQKFGDLKKKYGDDMVGLLTGDISINRDAPIVVMTTEVFRNMLYGTHFGDVNKNVERVACVVLDECHYMNDAERGTVWEESIIYCPADIQLVALSATVANAAELTAWIDQTHGPTKLVLSDFRPVPLRYYYFGMENLFPLLHSGGGLNGQLRSLFGKRHDRFNKKAKRGKMEPLPDPRDLLRTLAAKNMLPAICFLFSRRGCEEAMKKTGDSRLLSSAELVAMKRAVDELIAGNDNLKTHPHLEYLYKGVAVHHAGMLPSWKVTVEKLFQRGLIKAVFATETLAAGINMPARTTAISAISKRSDDGHRFLTASEFLQMSGRAGRRGMDELGHVVVLRHPFEHVEDVARLAVAPPDPLTSRFTPSYGMVLNLLQRHTIDEARDLVERSFGQFVMNHELEPMFEQKMAIEDELKHLSSPLCPTEIGDLYVYRRRMDAHLTKSKQVKLIKRGGAGKSAGTEQELFSTVRQLESEMSVLMTEASSMPCHNCPVQKPCSKQAERIRTLNNRLKESNRLINRESGKYWRTFECLANILRLQGYINADTVTDLGKMCSAIRATNELFIAEVVLSGVLRHLTPQEFASVCTAIVTEESRPEDVSSAKVDPQVEIALEKIQKIARKVYLMQRDFDIDIPVEFSPLFCGLSHMWASGASWEEIRHATFHDEGIVVRIFRRTLDLCRQIAIAPNSPAEIANLASTAERLMARDEVREDY